MRLDIPLTKLTGLRGKPLQFNSQQSHGIIFFATNSKSRLGPTYAPIYVLIYSLFNDDISILHTLLSKEYCGFFPLA
jgi:hypothetical protein